MSVVDFRAALTEMVATRTEMSGHDGRSGARLERIRLVDGTRLVVKTTSPADDLGMIVSGDSHGRELGLWREGHLSRLTGPVGHAVIDGWREPDGRIVTVMRDLGDAVLTWHRRLGHTDCRRILGAMAALHDTFAGGAPEGLCPLETYLVALAPSTAAPLATGSNPLPAIILRGWERAAELIPSPVMDALESAFADPAPLARALRADGTTLVHGDLWPVNVALEPDRVTLLDWGLAVDGPPALDLATFMIAAASITAPDREDLIAGFRRSGGAAARDVLEWSLLAVLGMYAWNKALDVAEHPDPAVRRRERTDLDWWVRRAAAALDA